MKRILILLIFSSIAVSLFALPGDTLVVKSHNKVDQVWYGNYDRLAHFPTAGKSFQKIVMKYTLGCPASGCSDWDYDVNVWLMKNTGRIDTVIAKIDTISLSPLKTDTSFSYNKVYDPFELGRYITPYGTYMNFRNPGYKTAGFDSSWKHVFYYDVTDFASLLKDSVLIRNQYRGWSSGFQCTIEFIFVEGTPARPVLSIQNIYTSGGTYTNPTEFEDKRMPGRMMYIHRDARDAEVKVIITGHGADKANGCGEFCDKNYYFKVNGKTLDTARMWRDDCHITAVKPQGGTWLFSRANWCPGDKVYPFYHNLKSSLKPGDSMLLDIDLDPSIATGNNAASYNASAVLFVYGNPSFKTDAAIEDIMVPSSASEYKHWNPSCNQPKVILRNLGMNPLTRASIKYGAVGLRPREFVWKGNIPFMGQDTVTLPTPYWDGVNFEVNRFFAEVNHANHLLEDDNPTNDKVFSSFVPAPRLEAFTLMMRTNGQPQENKLTITNEKGEVVFLMEKLDPNKIYQYDLNLPAGCYELLLTDEGQDGLHFWYYNNIGQPTRTNGWFRLNKKTGGTYLPVNGDFGSEIRYNFIVGNMTVPEAPIIRDPLTVFPNPAGKELIVQIPGSDMIGIVDIQITDLKGRLVKSMNQVSATDAYWYKMSLDGLTPGMYIVEVNMSHTGFEMPMRTEKIKTKLIVTQQ